MADKTRVAFAFAGWPVEAAAVRHLVEVEGDEVVTLTLDLGQGQDLDGVREAALEAGAVRAHVMDVRDALALEFLLPALKACGAQQGGVPLARELRLAAIARSLIEVAGMENATFLAHGGAPRGRQPARAPRGAGADAPARHGRLRLAGVADGPGRGRRRRIARPGAERLDRRARAAPGAALGAGEPALSRDARAERDAGDAGDAGARLRRRHAGQRQRRAPAVHRAARQPRHDRRRARRRPLRRHGGAVLRRLRRAVAPRRRSAGRASSSGSPTMRSSAGCGRPSSST